LKPGLQGPVTARQIPLGHPGYNQRRWINHQAIGLIYYGWSSNLFYSFYSLYLGYENLATYMPYWVKKSQSLLLVAVIKNTSNNNHDGEIIKSAAAIFVGRDLKFELEELIVYL